MKYLCTLVCAVLSVLLVYSLATEEKRHGKKLIGVTAQCNDGMFTTSKRSQGACSGHGGVKYWIDQGRKHD